MALLTLGRTLARLGVLRWLLAAALLSSRHDACPRSSSRWWWLDLCLPAMDGGGKESLSRAGARGRLISDRSRSQLGTMASASAGTPRGLHCCSIKTHGAAVARGLLSIKSGICCGQIFSNERDLHDEVMLTLSRGRARRRSPEVHTKGFPHPAHLLPINASAVGSGQLHGTLCVCQSVSFQLDAIRFANRLRRWTTQPTLTDKHTTRTHASAGTQGACLADQATMKLSCLVLAAALIFASAQVRAAGRCGLGCLPVCR